jgi:UDP-glucose 4-epimerase
VTDLVTGGAGFIGSHLVARLALEGRRVRVLDNGGTGRWENLAAVRGDIEVITGDVRDPAVVSSAVRGCEVVFHQAAEVSVPGSIADPRETYAVNVDGTMNVLLAARDAGCCRVVVASSSAVYGPSHQLPKHEEMLPQPISPYAATKLADEHLCTVFHETYGLETVALRYFNVYGPRQDPTSPYAAAIPKFLQALSIGERPVVYGDGEQTRDFVFVEDVVTANVRAATAPAAAGLGCNVATGHSVTLNAILAMLASVMDVEVAPIYRPARAGDVRHSAADVSRARERLGFTADIGLEEGLTRTIGALTTSDTFAPVLLS